MSADTITKRAVRRVIAELELDLIAAGNRRDDAWREKMYFIVEKEAACQRVLCGVIARLRKLVQGAK